MLLPEPHKILNIAQLNPYSKQITPKSQRLEFLNFILYRKNIHNYILTFLTLHLNDVTITAVSHTQNP